MHSNEADMKGKVALVTGAGSGIGAASAGTFARAGAKVAVVDRDGAAAEKTVAVIKTAGGEAISIQCDVTDETAVGQMVATVVQKFGGLDIAHNNVGISPDTGTTVQCTRALWDHIMAVNLTSTWLCMKHEIAVMLERGGGAIVNTGSAASLKAFPQISAYVASKHGLIGLTKVAALEYAEKNIRINAICPGNTLTPMLEKKASDGYFALDDVAKSVPMHRLGSPQEVANAAVWLCSAQATYVTGSVLSVDGGMMLS